MRSKPRSLLIYTLLAASALALLWLIVRSSTRPDESAKPPLHTIDTFDDIAAWRAAPASGVDVNLSSDTGHTGSALKVSFDFHGRGGWAAFRTDAQLQLPENYEISFWLKGEAPSNTLELKLVDPSGENVWWVNRREFEFAGPWRKITFRKRHVTFAWGPAGGGDIRTVGAIEFAITAGQGGKGTIWIDELSITPLEPVRPYDAKPVITSVDNIYIMDFTRMREYGGIIVDWRTSGQNRAHDVQISMDGSTWHTLRTVRGGMRQRDYLQLPETESRYLRIVLQSNAQLADIQEVRVMPLEWGESRNELFASMARDAPRGTYPRYLGDVMSYWTLIGTNGGDSEALMNEDGAVEVDKGTFSIEPFLYTEGKLITWSDARISQSLVHGELPIPTVTWQAAGLTLDITSWRDRDTLWLEYRVASKRNDEPMLFLAVRPFQVNSSAQFLNTTGGATTIRSIQYERDGRITIDDARQIVPNTEPTAFGATTMDQGDIVDFIRSGAVPDATSVNDTMAAASGALAYRVARGQEEVSEFHIAVVPSGSSPPGDPGASFERVVRTWRAEVGNFSIRAPDPRLGAAIRSNLAYILINRDGAAIQPGSRSYERSWIRDGSLTSAALLRLGHAREVREFIEWFAPYQYADGKVPCCVDRQGAGPVPENDSHGQLIYLIAEYFRFTGDTALVRRVWPHVANAVAYMDSLRDSRRTAEYRNTPFFGMMPQSISHEGYSAKPMHSYWDDFFALKGFKDAAWLAGVLGDPRAPDWARIRDEFQADLMQSLRAAMSDKGIDYLPGSVELGDFDATSTTVGVNPAGAGRDLPQDALQRTFEKYWDNFVARRDSNDWESYTPYEWRVVGTLVRLGQRRRAHELANWLFQHMRPEPWNHWAEVVFRDRDALRFIGDMPHTWVGSDFIRSVLDMFVHDDDDTLILAAGIVPEWLDGAQGGVTIQGVHTPYGEIGYEIRRKRREVTMRFTGALRPPPKGIVVKSPLDGPIRAARANGRAVEVGNSEVRLATLPRELVLSY